METVRHERQLIEDLMLFNIIRYIVVLSLYYSCITLVALAFNRKRMTSSDESNMARKLYKGLKQHCIIVVRTPKGYTVTNLAAENILR